MSTLDGIVKVCEAILDCFRSRISRGRPALSAARFGSQAAAHRCKACAQLDQARASKGDVGTCARACGHVARCVFVFLAPCADIRRRQSLVPSRENHSCPSSAPIFTPNAMSAPPCERSKKQNKQTKNRRATTRRTSRAHKQTKRRASGEYTPLRRDTPLRRAFGGIACCLRRRGSKHRDRND